MPLERYKKIQLLLWIVIAVLGVVFAFTKYHSTKLPDEKDLSPLIYSAPQQTQTYRAPFIINAGDKKYTIEPMFDYKISGLIVTQNDLDDGWFNIYFENDPFNEKDVCLIWKENLIDENYKKMEFWSGPWTCNIEVPAKYPREIFVNEALSNNHLLPATPEISDELNSLEIGDQVLITGMLVNYSVDDGPQRKSSVLRGDTGNGACEVLYVSDIKVIARANETTRILASMSLGLLIIASLLKGGWFLFG